MNSRPAFRQSMLLGYGILTLLLALAPATRCPAQSELPVTASLDLLTKPTLGGQSRLAWCGLADVSLGPVALSGTVQGPGGTAERALASQTLWMTRGVPQDAEFPFATPLPGRYRIRVCAQWSDPQGVLSSLSSLAFEIAPDGKVTTLPDVTRLAISGRAPAGGAPGAPAAPRLAVTASGGPTAAMLSASPDFTGAAWQPFAASLALPAAAAPTLYYKVRDAAGRESAAVSFSTDSPAVLNPATAGLILHAGGTYAIQWSGFSGANVGIDLYLDSARVGTITTTTANTGAFSWKIPATVTFGSHYTVVISSQLVPDEKAASPNPFVISNPQVLSPAAGAIWFTSQANEIRWSGIYGTTVKIELYKGAVLNRLIAPAAPNNGSFTDSLSSSQVSGNDFTILVTSDVSPATEFARSPVLIVSKPEITNSNASGTVYVRGQTYYVAWTGIYSSRVWINLSKSGVKQIVAEIPNNGGWYWTVAENLAAGNDYKFEVRGETKPDQVAESHQFFTIVGPGLVLPKVIYPATAGLILHAGSTYTIQWAGLSGDKVGLDLYSDTVRYSSIATSAANTGTFSWRVPATIPLGGNYRVVVASQSIPAEMATSANPFVISNPQVLSPAAGAIWFPGQTYPIRWSGINGTAVKIELYKGTVFNRLIASAAANNGSFSYALPATQAAGNDFTILITSNVSAHTENARSPALIISKPEITNSSASGTVYLAGQTYTIAWSGIYSPRVSINLYRNGVFNRTLAETPNTGAYIWTVAATQAVGSDYKFVIRGETTPDQVAESRQFFNIAAPLLTYPSAAGIALRPGSPCTIRWSGLAGATVKIQLYKGTGLNATLATGAPNNGSFVWNVASTQPTGSDYRIKIYSAQSLTQTDQSDNPFTITTPRVTYPTLNNVAWFTRGSVQITWAGFPGTTVRIDLYKGASLERNITASTLNNGSFTWSVPSTQALGGDYRILVTALQYRTFSDFSDSYFAVVNPRVSYPTDSGPIWLAGHTYTVTWTGYSGANVKIDLLRGTTLDRTLTFSTPNDGAFSWTVPTTEAIGTNFKFRVISTTDSAQTDLSDNAFSIASPRVTFPTVANLTFHRGRTYTITWSGFIGANVRVEVYSGSTQVDVLSSSTTNDGSFDITIPSNATLASDYRIKVISTTDSNQYDYSDSYFTIAK